MSSILTSKDYMLLQRWLADMEQRGDSTEALRKKLGQAAVVMSQDVPDDVVTVNSRVRFKTESGLQFERVLIASSEREVVGLTLPLDSPRGLGLLGMRTGQSATVTLHDGTEDTIEVQAILDQPEARRAALRRLHSGGTTGSSQSGTIDSHSTLARHHPEPTST